MFKSHTSTSQLYNQDSFDRSFLKDIHSCRSSLIIESPFIRLYRMYELIPTLTKLRKRGVHIVINAREPSEHDFEYQLQAEQAITLMQDIGICVLYTVKQHRKLAIIDHSTFWEGSLNILSYYESIFIILSLRTYNDYAIVIVGIFLLEV